MAISRIKTDGIEDAAISTAKIADAAINSAKIGVDVIAAEDLAANSITVSEISNGAVTSAKLATQTGNVDFADNGKIRLGDSQDLQIHHNGSHSYVQDTGTGNLYLAGSNVIISNPTATETMAYFDDDGGASLWYDNAVKIVTTSTGINVTGEVSSNKGSAGTLATFTDGVNSNFVIETSSLLTTIGNGGGSAALAFKSNNTTNMTLAASGNVGIGTAAPSVKLEVIGSTNAATFKAASAMYQAQLKVIDTTALAANTGGKISFMGVYNSGGGETEYGQIQGIKENATDGNFAGALAFYSRANAANPAERMRIDSGGDVQIGKTDGSQNTVGIILNNYGTIRANSQAQEALHLIRSTAGNIARFYYNNTTLVGNINVTSTTTAYNTSSDYRLKTDAQPMIGASDRVLALKPVNFEWISSGDRVDGFLAHEAQAVVPECVTGTKDGMEDYEITPAVIDEDGNVTTEAVMGTRPDYQGIDQSKLVPLLTAALQEALTKIAAMEVRLTALES